MATYRPVHGELVVKQVPAFETDHCPIAMLLPTKVRDICGWLLPCLGERRRRLP